MGTTLRISGGPLEVEVVPGGQITLPDGIQSLWPDSQDQLGTDCIPECRSSNSWLIHYRLDTDLTSLHFLHFRQALL